MKKINKRKLMVAIFFIATMMFFVGWHDIDNAYNLKTIEGMFKENNVNISLVDNSVVSAFNSNGAYMMGTSILLFSLSLFASIIIYYIGGDKNDSKKVGL